MPAARESVLHQQALIVMGFFTGFAITALVVIMQSPVTFRVPVGPLSAENYFESLVTAIAVVGAACVVGVLATMEIAAGTAETGSSLDKFGHACFLVSLFGLVSVLPLLLLPFTRVGSAVLVTLEVILLIAYFGVRRQAGS